MSVLSGIVWSECNLCVVWRCSSSCLPWIFHQSASLGSQISVVPCVTRKSGAPTSRLPFYMIGAVPPRLWAQFNWTSHTPLNLLLQHYWRTLGYSSHQNVFLDFGVADYTSCELHGVISKVDLIQKESPMILGIWVYVLNVHAHTDKTLGKGEETKNHLHTIIAIKWMGTWT